jgi:hypothetical protein
MRVGSAAEARADARLRVGGERREVLRRERAEGRVGEREHVIGLADHTRELLGREPGEALLGREPREALLGGEPREALLGREPGEALLGRKDGESFLGATPASLTSGGRMARRSMRA